MKKIQITFLLITMLSTINTSFLSQNTGYLGSKISIESTFNFAPSTLSILDRKNTTFSQKFNFNPNFGISLTVSENLEIGFNYGMDKINVQLNEYYDLRDYNNDYSSFIPKNNYVDIKSSFFDIVFKQYRSYGYIAPVGSYYNIIVGMCKFNYIDKSVDGRLSSNYYGSPSVSKKYDLNDPFKLYRIGFGLGKKTILFKKLYLNFQANAYLYFGKDKKNDIFDNNVFYEYEENLKRSLIFDKTIDLRIGIGWIL